ncbi:ABC transporter permease subunit [Paenibacillus sp. LMG 31460]|uniref:ABC transporter permease subunit n=2 Tax=Paenibacillus germinis TaxID=2654979 RepID=A0ABX1ZB23_9BACL|nr:ABC transporter permease subunit [Paenibacillus germinis]
MLVPGMLYLLVFKYFPLLGSVIAFQDYNIFKGFSASPWVGLKWFEQFLTYPNLKRLLVNTLMISLYQIIFTFPAPIILAVLLNEVKNVVFKRVVQTIVYLPHFLSWTIVFGFVYMLLSVQTGFVNQAIQALGGDPINFLQKAEYFRMIIITSGIWKEMGWSAIIFLAAIAGINPSLYEAAKMDGAGRLKQFVYVTLPGMLPAIMILLLLKIGHILDLGFEQIYLFLNPLVLSTGDVLDTYAYRIGILGGKYSLTTAIGLFKSVIGFMLLIVANRASKTTTGEGLY